MATINAVLTGILVLITGIYAWLTYGVVHEARRANSLQEETSRKQFRLQSYPKLFMGVSGTEDGMQLRIMNVGENPALDVEAYVVGWYHEDELSLENLFARHGREGKPADISVNEEGFYGLMDPFVYSVFPPRKQVVADVRFPVLTGNVHVIMQFRDVLGENYSSYYWFTEEGREEYVLQSVKPTEIKVSPRLERKFGGDRVRLVLPDGVPIPSHVQAFAEETDGSVIPSGLFRVPFEYVVGKGEWHDL